MSRRNDDWWSSFKEDLKLPNASPIWEQLSFSACRSSENDEKFGVRCEFPGLKKEELQVDLSPVDLTISTKNLKDQDDDLFRPASQKFRSYREKFTLPRDSTFLLDKAESCYCEGVLKVTIPKNMDEQHKQQKRNISIK